MSKTLDEIRKKLAAMEPKKAGGGKTGPQLVYPHWNLKPNTGSEIRLLPDGNDDNVLFWSELQKINLTFPGVKGHDENKPITIAVPCIETWDGKNKCPILNEIRPWWNDDALKATASKYWVKRSYFMQGYVVQSGIEEAEVPENPIRRFNFTNQIFNIVKAALVDPELEQSPVDFVNGLNFFINATQKGNFADYTTSKWARRESAVAQHVMDAIANHGLPDLSSYLPERPDSEHISAQFDMFKDSLDGELYDPAKYGDFYKPYGLELNRASSNKVQVPANYQKPSPTPAPKHVPDEPEANDPPFDVDDTAVATPTAQAPVNTDMKPKLSPQELLAQLRNRK